ncbi:MAG: glycosyl hydrolase 53 family protein [Terracidiphilus sp.]|jgi:arabinogalactan endo-1,4-beta-galactosidase
MKTSKSGNCTVYARLAKATHQRALRLLLIGLALPIAAKAQQPTEPVNISPIDGETYYLINQLSGLQMDLDSGSTTAGASILIESRSFTSLTQRWALTHLPSGSWAISNLSNGLCLDSTTSSSATTTVQNPCAPATTTQQWSLTATSNGYSTFTNAGTGLLLDVSGGSSSAGATLNETAAGTSPTQSQQWLLRPVFFRGIDNALLEKQEADRLAANLPWWQDAGQQQDVLQILKNHGVNLIRIRPTSAPPYQTLTLSSPPSGVPATCTANGCYAETDSADLDLAKRAKQLGMSVELTLFFDGGSSQATPGVWSGYSLTQAETAVYDYVKSEVEAYRSAGVMPDMVTIGNEVDTGFFGSLASPTGTNFGPFASLQTQGMQAVLDASSDTTIGPAIPAPLRCIHITPAWNLTSFFNLVNSNNIPYDAICQSYYPIYHGPLTAAQAAASNPSNQPVEQSVLTTAATSIAKPIFLIEVGEHYENGFDSNDPWYPATVAGQRQYLIDINGVLKGLPNNLGMGLDYWDAEGVNTAATGGGYTNGDGAPNGTYVWNGLTIFDNADTSGSSLSTAANYSALLEAADALGGKIDSTLTYKLVNVASGSILEISGSASQSGTPLQTAASNSVISPQQQWSITSNGDGYLQIANIGAVQGTVAEVLDNSGSSTSGSAVVLNAAATGTTSQEWNLITAGSGYYTIVNKLSNLVLAVSSSGAIQQQSPSSTSLDWITPVSQSQLWQVIPVHITAAAPATAPTSTALTASSAVVYPGQSVTLTATVTSAGGTPTGTVTFLDGSAQLGTGTLNGSGVTTYTGTLSQGANSLTADYAGTAAFEASNSPVVTVTVPDYSVTASQSSLTVSPGSSGSVSLTVTPIGGYNGTVAMSCATALAGVTCTFSPSSYTLDGSNTVLTGTASIAASSSASVVYPQFHRANSGIVAATIVWLPGVFSLLLVSLERKRLLRNPHVRHMFLILAMLFAAACLSACGGSGGGGTTTPPPVTGTVTITGTGSVGSVTQSLPITVTVE